MLLENGVPLMDYQQEKRILKNTLMKIGHCFKCPIIPVNLNDGTSIIWASWRKSRREGHSLEEIRVGVSPTVPTTPM